MRKRHTSNGNGGSGGNGRAFNLLRAMDAFAATQAPATRDYAITHACGHAGTATVHTDDPTWAQAEWVRGMMRRRCPACEQNDPTPDERHMRAFIRRWMAARRGERARATILRLAPYLRSGYTMSEALAGERAVAAQMRYEMRDAETGRVCCSGCGAAYDDAEWDALYSDSDCRPDDDELLCAACAFGGLGA